MDSAEWPLANAPVAAVRRKLQEQIPLIEGYEKTWYFATNTFNQEIFLNQGYSVTYIYQGTIDVKHPYTLYLIQKCG